MKCAQFSVSELSAVDPCPQRVSFDGRTAAAGCKVGVDGATEDAVQMQVPG